MSGDCGKFEHTDYLNSFNVSTGNLKALKRHAWN